MDEELAAALQERTLESLDFDLIIDRLRKHCCTAAAVAMTQDFNRMLASSAEEARSLYAAILEMRRLDDSDLVLEDSMDIEAVIVECNRGQVPELADLASVAAAIKALLQLRNGLEKASARGLNLPTLLGFVERIELPDDLLDLLLDGFDDSGQLSERKFPQLADLRRRIKFSEDACAKEIKNVLAKGKYNQYLAEDGYMQWGGHYVLSVKSQYRDKVGEIYDQSRSGRVAYVEPAELAPMAKELTDMQKELKFTMRKIQGQMCVAISRAAADLSTCLQAAACVDLARARLFLGEDMEGEVPFVGNEGVILVRMARNPCLLLRGNARVIGYKLELGNKAQGLVLSGPNAGGKTVVLKTVGLLALLARCGIPVPAGDSPRVDFFEVILAQVGDMQTIVDDLSTYSAHLVASRIMISESTQARNRALVMLDEAGSGTDPAQGAALARAIIEELLRSGARVVATTHCLSLKSWALEDPRLETAAMEYKQGRPTFRLTRNAIGESHAIETAKRLEMPESVLQRAETLLSVEQRSLLALQREVEQLERSLTAQLKKAEEREATAEQALQQAKVTAASLATKEERLATQEADLLARQERMRGQLQAEHQARVDMHTRKMEDVLERLKQDTIQTGSGLSRLQVLGDTLEDLRLERNEQAEAAILASQRAKSIPGALSATDAVAVGHWVMVLARTPWYGFKGCVQRIQGGIGSAPTHLTLLLESGNVVDVEKTQVGRTLPPSRSPAKATAKKPFEYSKISF